ncbi:MAG TPA: 1,4-alpha-glucan branching protein GlgB [Usitatibacter sp.]|jgi:1,4-alpha-glucan branching enzyme|nr:1,4-alpha-glucan branching protein GlgB [Usitatibacter sp.]
MAMLTEHDIYLFKEGTHANLYRKLGCHLAEEGAHFAVWAPNARAVSVIGEWNGWKPGVDVMNPRWDQSGIWEAEVAGVRPGQSYKYSITTVHGSRQDRADPIAFYAEVAPASASRAWSLDYEWGDADWMRERGRRNAADAPCAVYEVHLGSWRRNGADRLPTYRDIAQPLAEYVQWLGFTHVELMPITEHPFYGSWGYQTTGYFAPTSRYGTPQDFMHLVDVLHRHGIGVILDWVPSHFPDDPHGLARFDGTHLYEHADPRLGFHPEWKSAIFNYGRHEVRAFLASSAHFWLEKYHIDGLRVDAVASMLYLDYGRKAGEWIPNVYGGKENLDAITFLKQLNVGVGRDFPDTRTIAEESTAWPQVSRPVHTGGLGFAMKWNMGWMHDTLDYFAHDPIHRRYHHSALTFSLWYAFSENFVLPLSHDEVVYGKRALIDKMPGDRWQKFANLRLLYGYMWSHPGKKLLFMGGDIGQWREWHHERELDWGLTHETDHAGVQHWLRDLNRTYREIPALHEVDFSPDGFQWVDMHDSDDSVITFLRLDRAGRPVLVACNFTPVVRERYRIGVPLPGRWREALNSDAPFYGGSGIGNLGGVEANGPAWHGRPHSLEITLPPLAFVLFAPEGSP